MINNLSLSVSIPVSASPSMISLSLSVPASFFPSMIFLSLSLCSCLFRSLPASHRLEQTCRTMYLDA